MVCEGIQSGTRRATIRRLSLSEFVTLLIVYIAGSVKVEMWVSDIKLKCYSSARYYSQWNLDVTHGVWFGNAGSTLPDSSILSA